MMLQVVYALGGKIMYAQIADKPSAFLKPEGVGMLSMTLPSIPELFDVSNFYVADDALTKKQSIPLITTNTPLIANGTNETIISGIPAGVQVEWPDGQTDIVTGGEIGFSVDLPGTYTFQFTAVPYLDQEITIEAIAAT